MYADGTTALPAGAPMPGSLPMGESPSEPLPDDPFGQAKEVSPAVGAAAAAALGALELAPAGKGDKEGGGGEEGVIDREVEGELEAGEDNKSIQVSSPLTP